jgi:hypothetical protein
MDEMCKAWQAYELPTMQKPKNDGKEKVTRAPQMQIRTEQLQRAI